MKLSNVLFAVCTLAAVSVGAATAARGGKLDRDLTDDFANDIELYPALLVHQRGRPVNFGAAKRRFYQWAGKRGNFVDKYTAAATEAADKAGSVAADSVRSNDKHHLQHPAMLQQVTGSEKEPTLAEQEQTERLKRKFYQWAG